MGSTCDGCCSDNSPKAETNHKRGNNPDGYRKESSSTSIQTNDNDESDFAPDDDYSPTEDASTTYDPNNDSLSYDRHSIDSEVTEKIILRFKNAVKSGNDTLAMSLVEDHPSLDLLDTEFENGDNALHVAVRNTAYNLILYLLTHGISV